MEVPRWLSEVFVLAGLVVLAYGCLRARTPLVRRLGIWIIWGTIGLAIWYWTDRWYLVLLGLVAWFAIPVGQATLMSRRLRFSIKRKLTPGNIDGEEFPELYPISNELRDLGFKRNSDLWLKPSPMEQGFRIFRHTEDSISAAVAVVRQGGLSLSYLIVASEDQDGTLWITWDYPLAYGFKLPPAFKVYRYVDGESVGELMDQHRAFMEINEVQRPALPENAEAIRETMEKIFSGTMAYNLKVGLLEQSDSGDEVRYSWRGSLYLAGQVFRDVISA